MSQSLPRLTPSRTEAQQWAPELLAELGMVDALRQRGIACDIERHPATGMEILTVHREGEPDRYVMVYDPLDQAEQLEIAGRVAAFFHRTDVFIDANDPRDPDERVGKGLPIGDDEPCSLQTRIAAELIAVTGRDPGGVTCNDDGIIDQMARLYVEAGGPEAARYVGTSSPWEEQREPMDVIDWFDRFDGLDSWCRYEEVGLDGLRALCDRVVARLSGGAGPSPPSRPGTA